MLWRTCVHCRRARTKASAASCRFPLHERHPPAVAYFLVALIEASMLESDDALRRARLALTHRHDRGFRTKRVAGKDGAGKSDLFPAEIADGGPERRVLNRQSDDQPEREDRVHQRLAELG